MQAVKKKKGTLFMQKRILFIYNEGFIFTYHINFDEVRLMQQLNALLSRNLESYYVEDKIINSENSFYSHITSSYELVVFLKNNLINNEIIDLSEIVTLIKSHNSPMRTPQTLMSISNILSDFNFKFVNKIDLETYQSLINQAIRKGLIYQIDYNYDLINIACNNKKVFNNLKIKLPTTNDLAYQRTITL